MCSYFARASHVHRIVAPQSPTHITRHVVEYAAPHTLADIVHFIILIITINLKWTTRYPCVDDAVGRFRQFDCILRLMLRSHHSRACIRTERVRDTHFVSWRAHILVSQNDRTNTYLLYIVCNFHQGLCVVLMVTETRSLLLSSIARTHSRPPSIFVIMQTRRSNYTLIRIH